jgi:hypothetical protein
VLVLVIVIVVTAIVRVPVPPNRVVDVDVVNEVLVIVFVPVAAFVVV